MLNEDLINIPVQEQQIIQIQDEVIHEYPLLHSFGRSPKAMQVSVVSKPTPLVRVEHTEPDDDEESQTEHVHSSS